MRSFRRVFGYIWPQWARLSVILCAAVVGGGLFSLSVATVLPLLKVMMGEEGLHGWVNRMIAQGRYGVRFYLPDSIDLSNPEKPDVMYHLRITSIESSSLAAAAGLEQGDMIVGAGSALVADQTDRIVSQVLLQQLVQVPADARILVQYRRLDESGQIQLRRTELSCGKKPVYSNLAQQLLRYVPSDDSRQHRRQAVISIIILMAVVTLVRCTARFYQDYTAEKVVDTALAELRQQAFEHSLYMPVGFFARRGSSDIVSRLVRDISSMGNGINLLLGKALREPFKAAGLIVLAVMIEPNLTLIFLCAAPLSLFVLSKLGRKMRQATKKSLASWAQMLGKLEEAITAVGVVKVYNRQEYEHDRFVGINKRLLKQQFRMAKVDAATGPILESLGMIAGSVALVFGAQWVYNSQLEPSSFFALLLCLGTAAETVRKTSDVWNKLQQSDAAAERVFVIMDEPAEQEAVGAVQILGVKDRIEFRDVCFSYPGTEKQVLQHINLSVCVGTNVAIVGPNGSGKTTLVNLLPRFYDTDRGQILIDGKGIRDISLRSLRDQIGLVTQQVVTFNDTIAANIAYGKLNAGIEQIVEAAGRAFADEFIRLLPKGYDSVIGEHGAGLSGGQLQRIVIARAILKNPAILIFDEATSQVDADSEAKIHQAIEQLMRGRTSFVIAHRLSTIVKADLIVVMDDGQIIAHGRHDQLLDRCSLYRTLYQTQLVKA